MISAHLAGAKNGLSQLFRAEYEISHTTKIRFSAEEADQRAYVW
jgi:hypothetical protein